jgi:hypothetical protein
MYAQFIQFQSYFILHVAGFVSFQPSCCVRLWRVCGYVVAANIFLVLVIFISVQYSMLAARMQFCTIIFTKEKRNKSKDHSKHIFSANNVL